MHHGRIIKRFNHEAVSQRRHDVGRNMSKTMGAGTGEIEVS